MAMDHALTSRPVRTEDFPLLARWLSDPAVARWWNHETSVEAIERDFGPTVRGEEPNEDLLVMLDGRPVALVQRSRLADYPDYLAEFAALTSVPDHAMTLDYLVGESGLHGQGLGSSMIRRLVSQTWRDHREAQAILVAVVAANIASWRALEKAGLVRVAEGEMEPDNPIDDRLHYIYRVDRPLTLPS